jgi:hypothetical protein
MEQRKPPQVVPPKKGNRRKVSKKEKQNEMKNFVKFSNTKDKKGLDKKRASDKDKIRLARKTKQLIRQAAQ